MKTLIEESKPKSKTAFKITVEVPSDEEEEVEEHTWLYFNNLFKEKRHPTSQVNVIQPRVLLQTYVSSLCGYHTYYNLRCQI